MIIQFLLMVILAFFIAKAISTRSVDNAKQHLSAVTDERAQIVIDHVDDMLGIYEQACYHSGKPEDIRRWDVIYTVFIKDLPEGKSRMELYNDLAEKHFVGERQIRRDVDDAVVRLTALLFGIDGVRNAKVLRGVKVLGDNENEM